MDIKEIAKTMTREEFINKVLDDWYCPSDIGLENCDCTKVKVSCEQCMKEAVKDIKFKGDAEMKKLNIIESMKMPIGTEFKVVYGIDREIDVNVILKEFENDNKKYKYLDWCDEDNLDKMYEFMINATFIPIQQPVSFMQAIKASQDGKTIRVEIGAKKYTYYPKNDKWLELTAKESKAGLSTYEILEGKWYIEEQ